MCTAYLYEKKNKIALSGMTISVVLALLMLSIGLNSDYISFNSVCFYICKTFNTLEHVEILISLLYIINNNVTL